MPYGAPTLAELDARLQARLESSAFWTYSERVRKLNQAIRRWATLTGQWSERSAPILTTAGTVWYSLPSTLTFAARAELNGRPLAHTSRYAIDHGRPGWEGETTADGSPVPTQPKHWISAGLTRFGLWPADPVGGQWSITFDGLSNPPTLTKAGAVIDASEDVVTVLLDETIYLLLMKEGGRRWKQAQALHRNFLALAAEQNRRLLAAGFYRKTMGLDLSPRARPMALGQGGGGAVLLGGQRS